MMSTVLTMVLGASNMDTSVNFYDRTFSDFLGWNSQTVVDGVFHVYTEDGIPKLGIMGVTANGEPPTTSNGSQLVLTVDNDELVDSLYRTAMELGGKDEGSPGKREGDETYKAYFRDIDGHKWMVMVQHPPG
jgi:uncharacterized glyoxalase superfamily protein PhnB